MAKHRVGGERAEAWRQALHDHMPSLRKRFGVSSLGLFGSRVRGQSRRGSDLDILVEFSTPPSLLEYVEVEEYLTELLGVRVDLVLRGGLKPHIGERILSEVVMV
jgi:predicted nucleotidyltransferase